MTAKKDKNNKKQHTETFMKKISLATLVAILALFNLIHPAQAQNQLPPPAPSVTFNSLRASVENYSDVLTVNLLYVQYNYCVTALPGGGDIFLSAYTFQNSLTSPGTAGSLGQNTWGPGSQSSDPGLILMASVLSSGHGAEEVYIGPDGCKVYKVSEGQTAKFDLAQLFSAPETGYYSASMTGLAWGHSANALTEYIQGDQLLAFNVPRHELRGLAVPEPSQLPLLASMTTLLFVRRRKNRQR